MEPPSIVSAEFIVSGALLIAGVLLYALSAGIRYSFDYLKLFPESLKGVESKREHSLKLLMESSEQFDATLLQVALVGKLALAYGAVLIIKSLFLALLFSVVLIYTLGELMSMRVRGREGLYFVNRLGLSIVFKAFTSPFNRLIEALTFTTDEEREEREVLSIEEMEEEEQGATQEEVRERMLLRNIVTLSNKTVSEIMTPRVDVVALHLEMDVKEVMEVAIESGYSRFPVYDGSPDKIVGFLYIKDLVEYLVEREEDYCWKESIREAYFVPGSKKIDDLLEEFREKKVHLALVVDEYGGSDGVVTLEDVLEEIVGEISDESDEE